MSSVVTTAGALDAPCRHRERREWTFSRLRVQVYEIFSRAIARRERKRDAMPGYAERSNETYRSFLIGLCGVVRHVRRATRCVGMECESSKL